MMNPYFMTNYGYGSYGLLGLGFLGILFMIFWWIIVIVIMAFVIRWIVRLVRDKNIYEKSPLEILKERYAKGEITKEEYLETKKELER